MNKEREERIKELLIQLFNEVHDYYEKDIHAPISTEVVNEEDAHIEHYGSATFGVLRAYFNSELNKVIPSNYIAAITLKDSKGEFFNVSADV